MTFKHLPFKPLTLAIAVALAAPLGWADDHDEDDEIPFDVAEIFFELNDTDGDLGIHALIDGEPWKRLVIEDSRGRKLLNVRVQRTLRRQGLTEFFFESAEPTFDELDPVDFFRRFPKGEYEVEGVTLDGQEMESETWVSHLMPEPPQPTVNGVPFATECDDEEPDEYNPTIVDSLPITIAWPDVTMSHPDADGAGAGVQPPEPVTIVNYQLVVEVEDAVFSLILPPGETSVTLPDSLLGIGDEFKYEVLAREESYNQTATESCFVLELD
ncbi:MAG: hypothetical protein GYB33_22835 [Gammaproteobacteria bacterium]|nr:hypothetical protein [Gammaproteobacteria bacterium]